MELTKKEESTIEKMFAESDNPNELSIAIIEFASQYLTKEEHVKVAKYLIDSIADFPEMET